MSTATLLGQLQAGILAKLEPLLESSDSKGPLKRIVVEEYGTLDDVEDVLLRHQYLTPIGILSLAGNGEWNQLPKPAGRTQAPDIVYQFSLSFVSADQRDTDTRSGPLFRANDLFLAAMVDQFIASSFWPQGWAFDPIVVTTSSVVDQRAFMLLAWNFSVRVRRACSAV